MRVEQSIFFSPGIIRKPSHTQKSDPAFSGNTVSNKNSLKEMSSNLQRSQVTDPKQAKRLDLNA